MTKSSALLLFTMLHACGGAAEQPKADVMRYDSVGVSIVEHSAAPAIQGGTGES